MKVVIGTNNQGKVKGAFIMALTKFINGDIWRD